MAKKKLSLAQKVNILRASVMGANDGIISVAGIVIGVAAATANPRSIVISGLSGSLAGMISMCMGEYVSVSSQKDSEKMALIAEKERLQDQPQEEFEFVKQKYIDQQIDPALAKQATTELMEKDALATGVTERYGFNIHDFTSPYAAAVASFFSFALGSILPIVAISMARSSQRILATVLAVIIALCITGYLAAIIGNSNRLKSVVRNVIAGMITMGVTFLIGQLFAR